MNPVPPLSYLPLFIHKITIQTILKYTMNDIRYSPGCITTSVIASSSQKRIPACQFPSYLYGLSPSTLLV